MPLFLLAQKDHSVEVAFDKGFQECMKNFDNDQIQLFSENIKSLNPKNESQNFRKKYLIGLEFYKNGDFVNAIENLLEFAKYSKSKKDSTLLANSYHNLGNAYYRSNLRELSKKYFTEAAHMKKFLSKRDHARVYQALGSINLEDGIGKNDSLILESVKSYEKVIKIYQKENLKGDEALATSLLAESFNQLKNHQQAIVLIDRAIFLADQVHETKQLNFALIKKASFLLELNKNEEALKQIEKPINYFKNNGERQSYQYALIVKQKILMALKKYEEAAKVSEEKFNVNVKIYDTKYLEKIAGLEASYDKLDKEKKIAVQEKILSENKLAIRNKNIYSILFASLFAIISIILIGFYKKSQFMKAQLKKEILLKDELNSVTTENKLQEQRLSISRDLHDNIGSQLTFIISSVDTLKLLNKGNDDKLNIKISNISAFTKDTIYELRDTIWAMNKTKISLEDLNGRISNYVQNANQNLEKINFEFLNAHSVKNVFFDSKTGISIYRFIQEAVNNAIKHAEANLIQICFREDEKKLLIEICDDGKGFPVAENYSGNGLKSMQKRAEEIGGNFRLESSELGTKVSLKIM